MKSNPNIGDTQMSQSQTFQSSEEIEEIEEILLQELDSLFDKPCLIPIMTQNEVQKQSQVSGSTNQQVPSSSQQQQTPNKNQANSFKVGFEKDYSNTFLLTNPQAIFRVLAKDQFLNLSESSQCIVLDRLDDILQKCSHNSLILTDHVVLTNVTRLNQQHIATMVNNAKNSADDQSQEQQKNFEIAKLTQSSIRQSNSKQYIPEHDILLLCIQLCMKVAGKHQITTKKLIDLIRRLTNGKRFLRCHLEYIYQYIKIRCAKLCQSGNSPKALQKLDTAINILVHIFEQRFDIGPTNYFYFSGFLSGIQVNTKTITHSEFIKGFTACMWFQLEENTLQDDRNLPVLFNVYFQGHGGFECYFNHRKLFYRMLGKVYTPPTVESNGILVGEFQPKKWYFFATEHERPSFTRPQFTAIINDKQVTTLPLDYPKIDKNAKVSMIAVCKNFVGLLSSFLLFKEPVNNSKKLIQMYNNFEYGFYSNKQLTVNPQKGSSHSSGHFNTDIFDSKIIDKLLILYSPERTSNKIIYDCVEMRDGELMVNSGVCKNNPKSKLFFTGGLISFLPLLDLLRVISLYQETQNQTTSTIENTFNGFLRLVNAVMASKSYSQYEQEAPAPFFTILFHLLGKLPLNAVNNYTIQLLAEIRFQIGDSKLQEQFFRNLMQSSDYWLNTDNIEVINEYWQFVKAIYAQNPIQYNRIFSIQNLIDLMVKISDIKDAGYCCEYHKNNYLMFYQGQISSQSQGRTSAIGGIIPRERTSQILQTDDKQQSRTPFTSNAANKNMILLSETMRNNIHQIDKYLAPIAGVLEGVLTSGGEEVLEQVQYIAKSLTVKSSPCFHMQMLKLLKVLLLDSRDVDSQHCASPGAFASHFLKANGLQILLYLCSNSSFDVKAMCVKLIDVLSSHTSLIKIAIDPDVITYLCNIILPRSMMDIANLREKSQIFKNISVNHERMMIGSHLEEQNINQYEIMEDQDMEESDNNKEDNEDDMEDEMNRMLMDSEKQKSLLGTSKPKKFGKGIFIDDGEEEKYEENKHFLKVNELESSNKNDRVSIGGFHVEENEADPFNDQQTYTQQNDDNDLLPGTRPPPPAPKSQAKSKKQFDFGDEDNDQESAKQKFNQTSKAYIFGNQQTITEENEDEDEEMKSLSDKRDYEGQGSSTGFGIVGFSKGRSSKDPKMQFMNTQRIPSLKSQKPEPQFKGQKGKALALTIDDNNDNDDVFVSKRTQGGGTRNTFAGPIGQKKGKGTIQFAEFDDEDDKQEVDNQNPQSKEKEISFANENVMSKSNLRERKQFNFGFPTSDSDDSEEKNESDEEEKLPVQETEEDISKAYHEQMNQEQNDLELYFENQFFSEKREKEPEESDNLSFVGATKKGSSLIVQSTQSTSQRNNRGIPLEIEDSNTDEIEMQIPQKKKSLFLGGGTTGATSDTLVDDSNSRERQQTNQQLNEQTQQLTQKPQTSSKKAVISFQKKAKIFTNANNKLNIDTDAINELFTYGGEQGQIKMTEEEEIQNFEAEIDELANMCIAAMNRKHPNDPIKYENRTKSTFESKYLMGESNDEPSRHGKGNVLSNPRSQFMTPQSVRGIKKIEFQMSQEEKQAVLEGSKDRIFGGTLGSSGLLTSKGFGLKSGMFSNNTILEEMSLASNTISSSSKQDFNFANNSGDHFSQIVQRKSSNPESQEVNINQEKPKSKSKRSHQPISFNQTQPNINFLEPIVRQRSDSNRKKSDDIIMSALHHQIEDELTEDQNMMNQELENAKSSDDYTVELENLYTSCLEWIISRAPSSLYENIVIDEVDKIGYQPAIQLLMTLVTYSNNLIRQRALNDLEMLAKWDSNNGTQIMVHPQFHQWLLELLMPYQDLASKYSNLQGTSLAVYDIGCKLHTLLLKNACVNSEEEAYKKINFLVRWPMIVQAQVQQGIKDRNEKDIDTANKITRILMQQLIASLKEETSRIRPSIGKNSPTWQNLIYSIALAEELILGSHSKTIHSDNMDSFRDVNVSLFKWIQNDYLLYYDGSNEKSLWAEWDLLEQIFSVVDGIFPDWIKNERNVHISSESFIFNIFEKYGADEFGNIVDILLHDGSPYKLHQQTHSQAHYPPQKQHQSKAKGLLSGVLGVKSHHHQQYHHQQQEQIPLHQQSNINSESSFMKSILNLICIALTQSDTKVQVQHWLERFELLVKYIMIISETWKSRLVSTVYSNYQRKFTECITFAFAFLFHEIHHTNTQIVRSSYNISNSYSQQQHSNTSSPKEQMFNKLYAQCLKNLMIFLINIIEYQRMRYSPIQLESHVTACRTIFTNILVKNYQGEQESLISFRDISRLKQSDYDDFPESFYMEDWKVTFFNSDIIKNIIKKQLNHQHLLVYLQRRKNYALNYLEQYSRNDKTKDEILKRMQLDTIEVIGQLSAEEFERKNKVALMNENFIREQGHSWKKAKQQLFSNRGIWRMSIGNENGYLKVNFYKSYDGVRPILNERFKNGFEFYQNEPELEKKIFSRIEVDFTYELFNIDKKQVEQSKQERKKSIIQKQSDEKQMGTSDDEDIDKEDEEDDLNNIFAGTTKLPIINFFSRTLTTREKISLKKQYINHLKEYIYTFRVKTKELINDMKCAILKPFYQRPGTITITSHDILFFDDLFTPANLIQEKDNIFFFKYQKTPDSLFYKIIPLSNIKEIQRRRFLGRKTSLEVFMIDGRSLLLNFQTQEDREQFAKKVIRQRNQRSFNLKYYDTLEPRRILKKRELTEKWMQWKISNFDYIMQLNQLAGRSFNDLSQYPVFPWILTDFTTSNTPDITAASISTNLSAGSQPPPQGFRDLNKNMQLLGTAERQAEFKRKYDDQDSFASPKEKFHCGSHYSNPGIVLHYMSRLSPYIDALVELHGKNLDTPDRGFHSVQDSLNNALSDHADVRELIPEFYFCPEMFINLNHIKFGVKQDGNIVDNVRLPQWCNNNPYLFVIFLREAFETNYVSQNLSSWIDFIFGYKQKDAEAERSLNTFSHLTYEDGIDIDSISDQLLKQSYQEQIYNYGQTPSQLFQKNRHPQRLPRAQALKYNLVVDSQSKIKVYKPVVQQQAKGSQKTANTQTILLTQEAILKAKFVDDQTIIGLSKDGTVTYFFWLSKAHELNPNTPFTCCEDKKRKFDNRQKQSGIEVYDRSIKKFDFPLLILSNQKCVLRGGFWGGKISICPIEGISQEQPSSLNVHQSTVTVITSTKNEKIVITGSKSGDIIVWNYIGGSGNLSHESKWQLRKHICDHEGMISTIHINEDMCMYMTCSFDGTANIYNLQNDKFFRSFQHPKLAPIHCGILTQTPLPACCLYSREDHYWQSYNLNGHFLDKQREDCSHIISPQVVKDSHFMDKLVYGTERGYLIFRQLPLLKQFKKQQVSTQYPVLSIIVSPDRRFLLVGCGDGGLNVVTEPFQITQGSSQIQSSNITQATQQYSNVSTMNQTTTQHSQTSSFASTTQSSQNTTVMGHPNQGQTSSQGTGQNRTGFGNIQQTQQNYSSSGNQNQFNQQHQYRE